MKKVIVIVILIVIFIASSFLIYFNLPKKEIPKVNNEDIEEIKEEEEKDEYIDNNPIILGLYKNYRNGQNRELITNYEGKFTYHKDISSFEVYYTNEEEISSKNQIKLFDEYQNNYENIADYRIGYIIEFTTINGNIKKVIKSPKDSEEFFSYLEIYLYDDYHRDGSWYSHTTEEEFNRDTLLTSIKLTAGEKIEDVISPIKVSAFTYLPTDFDMDGNYIGKSIYTITVSKK